MSETGRLVDGHEWSGARNGERYLCVDLRDENDLSLAFSMSVLNDHAALQQQTLCILRHV